MIIKHKLCLSDEEAVQQIQENPYLQYFVGLPRYQTEVPFSPTLFVEIRKRMGQTVFEDFHEAIIGAIERKKSMKAPRKHHDNDHGSSPPSHGSGDDVELASTQQEDNTSADDADQSPNAGKLILDATVAEQAIRYPTDLSLLNEAREAFLAIVKQRRPGRKVTRRGIKQQLQYLRRNLGHIEKLMATWPVGSRVPLPRWLMHRYWVIQHLHDQQMGDVSQRQQALQRQDRQYQSAPYQAHHSWQTKQAG